ncbi:winged helix-turn-helix transcriptional regulator [Candidatus Woesearchaeota archaeon]|nr:winged helix-turn-helix transcriptional regulator [Candidatus Woesearchaeota archaeon]
MKRNEYGTFCKIYGKSLRNKVLEFILELGELDFAVSDILEEVNISKPKLYQIIKELEEENIIKKSREVSGTQLFILNKKDEKVNLLIQSFNECLRKVIDELKEYPVLEAEVYVDNINILDKLAEVMPV